LITVNIVLKNKKTEVSMPEARVLYQELQQIFEPEADPAIYPKYEGTPVIVKNEEQQYG
jgi:predicted Rdx family selenoprotein